MNKRQRKKTGKRSVRNVEDMVNEQETQVGTSEQADAAQAETEKAEDTGNGCGTGAEAEADGEMKTGAQTSGKEESAGDTGEADVEQPEAVESMKAEYEAKIEKLTDQLKRNMAEFDNYRKRTEQEKLQMFDRGVSSVAEKILPTIDNFDRAMTNEPTSEEAKAFVSGMELVYKSFMKALEDIGIKPIECVGKEFDPNLHHAVMHEDDDSGEQNIITEEFQKGYTLKDKVIRCSMVKVKN